MKYDDLLNIRYLSGGRDKKGMDCYGVVLECCRRNGTPLKDICEKKISESELYSTIEKLNVREIEKENAKFGDIMQCVYNGELHIGFLIDKNIVIHATEKGVRITPIIAFENVKYGRIENEN